MIHVHIVNEPDKEVSVVCLKDDTVYLNMATSSDPCKARRLMDAITKQWERSCGSRHLRDVDVVVHGRPKKKFQRPLPPDSGDDL